MRFSKTGCKRRIIRYHKLGQACKYIYNSTKSQRERERGKDINTLMCVFSFLQGIIYILDIKGQNGRKYRASSFCFFFFFCGGHCRKNLLEMDASNVQIFLSPSSWRIPKLSILDLRDTFQHFRGKNVPNYNYHFVIQIYLV